MSAPTPTPAPTPMTPPANLLKPPTTLLMGDAGAGKTDSLTTFIEAGLDLFVIGTEPNFEDTLLDACRRRKLDVSKLHWHYVAPASPGMTALDEMAKDISEMSFESLSRLKAGLSKQNTQQFRTLLGAFKNFVDQRDGKSYGPIFDFGPDKALAVDSLSGMNVMAKDLMVGYKPTAAEGEWGVAMNLEENTIRKLVSDTRCFFVLTAHLQKVSNEITGTREITLNALGNKLAPKLPPLFSEVVLAKRGADASKFRWSTADVDVTLKNRALPISPDLQPTFVPIVNAYKARVAQLAPQPQPEGTTT